MAILDKKEQKHVRTALRYLHRRTGTVQALADALGTAYKTLEHMLGGRTVSAAMAIRVARLTDVGIDDLLAGRTVPAGTCPHCGRPPDFADEDTIDGNSQFNENGKEQNC